MSAIKVPYCFSRIRRKSDGEVGVIKYESFSSSGRYYGVYWSRSNTEEDISSSGPEFSDNYEEVCHDYSPIESQVLGFLKSNHRRQGILDIISRRMEDNYFEPGKQVFFTLPGYLPWNKDVCGPEYPLTIIDVTNYRGKEFTFIVILVRFEEKHLEMTKKELTELRRHYYSTIEITYSLEEFDHKDAYHLLSRYDKEF